ncbi:MAG: Ig-like domain-containing protein, partial [Leifsonia flava]
PSGKVLAVRSLDIPDEARVLSIEVLNSSVVRVTSSAAVTEQLQFSYTVSDGVNETVSTIAIVPVPPLTRHQAPLPADDVVTVRAGDIASVPALDNDIHPDIAVMTLAPDLVEPVKAGLAFIAGDRVRFQAPREPGVYTATYAVTDDFKQKAVATVTFNVVAEDKDANEEPAPKTLTARVFADSAVTVNVPLDGLDPNGDSVVFDGLSSAPAYGSVTDSTSTAFTYTAAPGSAGTDIFSYRVKDVYGATAIGTVRIGVIERPEQDSPPIAVDDTIEVQPGRVATVPVLGNDSDPNGYTIEVSKKLKDVPEGVTAVVKNKRAVEIEAPDEETSFVVRYEITNGQGGFDTAFVQVRVTKDATIAPPTVIDHIVEPEDVLAEKTIDIDVTKGANNSGGRVEDLEIAIEGPNKDSAELLANGMVRVTLGDARTAIAYRLTNTTDDLSSAAFIVVPPYSDGLPPRIKLTLPTQYVDMNETKSWKLSDIAESPTGKDIRITEEKTVSAIKSDGAPNFVDDQTLTFTPAKDYRGPASITFEATDGSSTGVAMLVLPITVGDPEMKDVAPTFTPPELTIEAGEPAQTLDLRTASDHPNPEVLAALSYSGLSGMSGGIEAGLSGSTLTVSAPFGVQPGTATTLNFTITYKKFTIPGTVHVRVVSSSKPLPSTVDDRYDDGRKSTPVTMNVLANDFNPFPDQPLTIIDATVNSGAAAVRISGPNLIITPGPDKSQQISVIYKVEDATKDQSRHAQGRADVIVTDVPDQPPAPTLAASSKKIAATINPSPSNNGAAISSYTVTRNDGVKQSGQAGETLTFAGENGTQYSFTVFATNKVGNSEKSASRSATSYGKPTVPRNVSLENPSGDFAPTTLRLTWAAPSDDGGGITSFSWQVEGVDSGTTGGSGTRASATANTGDKTYNGRVQACGPGGCSDWSGWSSVYVKEKPPPPPPNPRITNVYGTDGPQTRTEGSNTVSNTYRVGFSWADYPGGSYRITPQFCSGGNWEDVSSTYDVTMNGSDSYVLTAWIQPAYAPCGIRVKVNGVPTQGYPFP